MLANSFTWPAAIWPHKISYVAIACSGSLEFPVQEYKIKAFTNYIAT